MGAAGYVFGDPAWMARALGCVQAYTDGDEPLLHELLDTGGPDAADVAVALVRLAYCSMVTVSGITGVPVRQLLQNTHRQALGMLAEDTTP